MCAASVIQAGLDCKGQWVKAARIIWFQDSPQIMTDAPDNRAQLASPSYRLPVLDQEFLLGDSMRGLRFQIEYQKAEEALRRWGVESTVVVFGSARVRPDDGSGWYEAARRFARLCSDEGGARINHVHGRINVIATGGGPGIMEAANRGAHDAGAPSVGYNITLPLEQEPNAYSTPDLTFRFHYFAMRKMHFAMRAAALVVFPGGFGTLDEMFELLTLRQTGKIETPLPIVLYDKAFWTRTINFQSFVDAGLIAPRDLNLFAFASTPEETWQQLLAQGLKTSRE
jgi:hypothetical protein